MDVPASKIKGMINSTTETWKFLTNIAKKHAAPLAYCDSIWLEEVWCGNRLLLDQDKVTSAQLIHIKKARVSDIVSLIVENGGELYLPPPKKSGKPIRFSRKWLVEVRAENPC